tara:strand:- start:51 stop:1007 length:957 start_codon:yes stop_codon:yes gene_type:complete
MYTDTLEETSEVTNEVNVPSDGEMVAESHKNQGPHTQSINFSGLLESYAKILSKYGIVCYILKKEKTISTLEGTWQPDFVAVHVATGIIVAIGECQTSHANWATATKNGEDITFTKETQPKDRKLKYSSFKNDMKAKSTNFDSVTGLCEENELFKPFMFYVLGLRTVDSSEQRTAESKEHMETHILKRMFERHGVDHVMCNQYTIGKNKDEQHLFGSDRETLKDAMVDFVKQTVKFFEENPDKVPNTIPAPLGSFYSDSEYKATISACKENLKELVTEHNLKGSGYSSDFEAGIWEYGVENFSTIIKFIQKSRGNISN